MPITYHNGKKYVWRDGKPRVTEVWFQIREPRSSGMYGTGVYAYKTLERLLKEKSTDMYALDVTEIPLFNPYNLDDVIDLSKYMVRSINVLLNGEKIDDWTKGYLEKVGKRISLYRKIDASMKKINNAMRLTISDINKNGIMKSSQPVNHLLISNGYYGVEPVHNTANSNQFGIVIFKEYFEKKLGTQPLGMNDPVKFGIRINNRQAFINKALMIEKIDETVNYYKKTDSSERHLFNLHVYSNMIGIIAKMKEKAGDKRVGINDDVWDDYFPKILADKKTFDDLFRSAVEICIKETKNDEKCNLMEKNEKKVYEMK